MLRAPPSLRIFAVAEPCSKLYKSNWIIQILRFEAAQIKALRVSLVKAFRGSGSSDLSASENTKKNIYFVIKRKNAKTFNSDEEIII